MSKIEIYSCDLGEGIRARRHLPAVFSGDCGAEGAVCCSSRHTSPFWKPSPYVHRLLWEEIKKQKKNVVKGLSLISARSPLN